MKNSCTIKSSKYGITIILDPDIPYEQLIVDICTKFHDAKGFFGNVTLVLTIEGRDVTGVEIAGIVEAIELNSKIHISLVDQHENLKDARMAARIDRFYFEEFYQNAKIIPGTVKKDEEVTSDGSILILGDVKRGGRVEACGNIIVAGDVRGEVWAGCKGEESCYIVANCFDSDYVRIADVTGDLYTVKQRLFKNRYPKEPVAVVLLENMLHTEKLSGGIVKALVR